MNPYPFVLESEGGSITSRTYSKTKLLQEPTVKQNYF